MHRSPTSTDKPYNLIFTLGSSPAILTETIWTLFKQGRTGLRKIIVVTTTHGRDRLKEQILEREDGYMLLDDLFESFGLSRSEIRNIQFPDENIIIPSDSDGHPMDDINDTLADKLFFNEVKKQVATFCIPAAPTLKACLAGGRKTMSAHLHAAMQLFGREGDEMFHVLVDPEHEKPGFFFPEQGIPVSSDASLEPGLAHIQLINVPYLPLKGLLQDLVKNWTTDYDELRQEIRDSVYRLKETPIRRIELMAESGNLELIINRKDRIALAERPFSLLLLFAVLKKFENFDSTVEIRDLQYKKESKTAHIRLFLHFIYSWLKKCEYGKDTSNRWILDENPDISRILSPIRSKIKGVSTETDPSYSSTDLFAGRRGELGFHENIRPDAIQIHLHKALLLDEWGKFESELKNDKTVHEFTGLDMQIYSRAKVHSNLKSLFDVFIGK